MSTHGPWSWNWRIPAIVQGRSHPYHPRVGDSQQAEDRKRVEKIEREENSKSRRMIHIVESRLRGTRTERDRKIRHQGTAGTSVGTMQCIAVAGSAELP